MDLDPKNLDQLIQVGGSVSRQKTSAPSPTAHSEAINLLEEPSLGSMLQAPMGG